MNSPPTKSPVYHRTKSNKPQSGSKGKTTRTLILPRKITESKSLELVGSSIGPIETRTISTVDRDILLDRLRVEIIDRYHFSFASPPSSTTAEAVVSELNQIGKRKTNDSRTADSSVTKRHHSFKRRRHGAIEKDDRNELTVPFTPKNTLNDRSTPIINTTNLQDDMIFQTIRNRIVIGSNQCTRALELARTAMMTKPQLHDGGSSVTVKRGSLPSLVLLARDVRPPIILAHVPILCRLLQIPLLLLPGKASSDMGKLLGVKTASILIFLDGGGLPLGNASKAQEKCVRQIDSYIEFAKEKVLD